MIITHIRSFTSDLLMSNHLFAFYCSFLDPEFRIRVSKMIFEVNNYPAKSRGISPDILLIAGDFYCRKALDDLYFAIFPPTGYLLTTDDEYSVGSMSIFGQCCNS